MRRLNDVQNRSAKTLKSVYFGGGVTLKALSVAALAGLAFGAPAVAADTDVILSGDGAIQTVDLSKKPVDQGTLDYLYENNIFISQKNSEAIESPGSMFSITDANSNDFSFEYKTADVDGNITSSYYMINLNDKAEPDSLSSHVVWTEGNSDNPSDIAVKQLDGSFKYYHYEYASDYDLAPSRINNTLTSDNTYHKLFTGLSSTVGSAIYNTKADVVPDIISDFINNSAVGGTSTYSGGTIFNYANTIQTAHLGKIQGVFINNISDQEAGIINVVRKDVHSTAIIDSISGDFINNTSASGGAILNCVHDSANGTAIIGSISGNFINNKGTGYYGGAIWNDAYKSGTAKIGSISGNFINNYAKLYGGAIMNGRNGYNASRTIDNIKGNFINNIAGESGGVLYNDGHAKIGTITGDFVSNTATTGSGGAIYNLGDIDFIVGDFINNKAGDSGGAISSIYGDISDIVGNFINNSADIDGGALNIGAATVGDITGLFVHNVAKTGCGGVFWNGGSTVGNVMAHFIDNSAGVNGGVLCNEGSTFGVIVGNFINNSAGVNGGAIYNVTYDSGISQIGNIDGHFIGNNANESGGAIYNKAQGTALANIGTSCLIGNFIGNYVNANNNGYGGAIYNYAQDSATAQIVNITGDFIGNCVNGSSAYGGAISNFAQSAVKATIGNITGDFIGNYATAKSGEAFGGAIYNCVNGDGTAKIGDINGDFIGNYINSSAYYNYSSGGAIYSSGSATIGNIIGDFIGNYVNAKSGGSGGAIYNKDYSAIGNITGDFIGNYIYSSSSASGGAIYNYGSAIGNITGDFIGNYVNAKSGGYGGAIDNNDSAIGNITGDFIGNYVNAKGSAQGGAIRNYRYNSNAIATIGERDADGNLVGGLINSSFVGNYAKAPEGTAQGGAIWTNADLNIIANDGKTSLISGNYVEDKDGHRDEAIYVGYVSQGSVSIGAKPVEGESYDKSIYQTKSGLNSTLSLSAQDGGKIIVDDEIVSSADVPAPVLDGLYYDDSSVSGGKQFVEYDSSKGKYVKIDPEPNPVDRNKLAIKGDNTGAVVLNNNVKNFDVSLDGTNLYLGKDTVLNTNNNLTLNGGMLSMINDATGIADLNRMTIVVDTNFVADVDLKNKEMDRFTANEYGEHSGNLNVVGMNMLSDAVEGEDVTAVYFAQPGLKEHVTNGLPNGEIPTTGHQTEVYTPIYKYNVTYDTTTDYGKGDGGYFLFTKGDKILTPGGGTSSTGNASDAFNPAVLAAPVSATAASQATVNETFKYVFEHADAFTQMPLVERMTKINANKYAIADTNNGASTDFNENLGSLCPCHHDNKAAWFRPYSTFESMDLKHGPKVDAITYGSLAGFDTDFFEHKHGWHSVGTGYIGYNGSQLNYKGVDTTMNGGLLGYTHTMYKNNFWTALTLTAGASVGESRTMYGKEDFTSLMAGVGSKTGYNFEFKEGKYILQPIMFMSYTFANTFDYTNAAGVKIKPSPAHSIQLNPSVRFIANTKNGWQPYASVGMVWNVFNQNKVTANSVRLPEMGMKPYVEYGLGIQRNWKDKFTAFGQAMVRNGGRNGIALTAGFRWALGHDSHDHEGLKEKVQAPANTLSKGVRVQSQTKTVLKQLNPTQKSALGVKQQTTTRTTKTAIVKSL